MKVGLLGVFAWLLVLVAAGAGGAQPARPTTDEIQTGIDDLFIAARYDSILALIPGYIQRAQADHDSVLLGRMLAQRGRFSLTKGRQEEAERDIDLGIRTAESVRDTVGLMLALQLKGYVLRARGDAEGATRCFERRLDLARDVRSPVDEAWALAGLAYMRHQRGDHAGARRDYLRAIELARPARELSLEITALIGLGRTCNAVGDPAQAARSFERAWVLSREAGDRVNEMWATNNLGVLEVQKGDLGRAEQFQQRAYELARAVYPQGAVIPAIGLASRARDLGEYSRADAILGELREFCRAHSLEVYMSTVDFYIAHLRETEDRPREAAIIFHRLLRKPDRLDAQQRDWAVLLLARILADSDSLSQAEALVVDRLDAPDLNRAVRPYMYEFLSDACMKRNEGTRALAYATEARESAERDGRRRFAAVMRLKESICLRTLGRDEGASRMLGSAIDSLEALRGGTSTAEWREVYGQEVAYDVLQAARVLLEHPASLTRPARERTFFDAMQRFKTRTLLDRICEPRHGAGDALQRWPSHSVTTQDVQALLAPGELLLEFFVGSGESYLAAISPDTLRLITLPGADSPLAESIDLYHQALANPDARMQADFPAERIVSIQRSVGSAVLKDVADMIGHATRVLVAPDGFFASIPFGTLIIDDSSRMLMEGADVVQVPSASVLALQRSRPRNHGAERARIVALEAPESSRLPGAHDEVRELSRHYAGVRCVRGLTGGAETLAALTANCNVLHVATHARVVDYSPWQSGLRVAAGGPDADPADPGLRRASPEVDEIFSAADSMRVAQTFQGDPFVRAWQIATLELSPDLTVLAGCETAGGRLTSGEGVLGLTSAFISAGVPVVVSSLWPVDDRATALVMRGFYAHLANGEPVATALRLAQLEARRAPGRAHPFYWAGFTVVGDGSMVVPVEKVSRVRPAVLVATALLLVGASLVVMRRRRGVSRNVV